ncbi:MAG: Leucyl aminopeptidase [Frankiales bacterium]|nr:Leucyl aminopeptidase [Frankiales bacterium]
MAVLPALVLAGALPAAAVVALPTRPGDDDAPPRVLAQPPVEVAALLEREKAKGEAGELIALPVEDRVLLLGTGDGGPAALRKAGAAIARRAKQQESLALDLRRLTLTDDSLLALAEGLLLGSYGFTLKPSAEPRPLTRITVVVAKPDALKAGLDRALAVIRAVAAARDLVNTPALQKHPVWLAAQARTLLKGLSVTVRDDVQLREQGWGGLVAVGMGSSRPPRVVEASVDHRVGGVGPHVVLVGKGITFDTGGISIKPNDSMLTMKMDMGGAAAVLATLRAVADLKLPVKVTAIACAAENMPSGSAQRPSDVITQYGGTTVEVLNTDAEGRLVLADGIAYADQVLDADVIVDVATLTGAMPVALGKKIAGLFTNDDALSRQLERAAEASGERVWRMPLTADYRRALDSETADLRNIGNPRLKLNGGSITAALFLQEFTGGRRWAHLDIAGPAWSGGDDEELTKGGTGYGVRLLTRWLEQLSAAPARKRARAS